jgi:hypothetical protein
MKFRLIILATACAGLLASGAAAAFPIPMCEFAGGYVPCIDLTLKIKSTTIVTLPAKATPNWGRTEAQVQSLFAYNILLHFETNPNLNAMFTGMDQFMLARLSTELAKHDASDYTYSIMAYAGEKLSGANLRRLAAAFGPYDTSIALAYASAATRTAYNASPVVAALPLSQYWWSLGKGAGITDSGDMYLYDLMLDSYTVGAGGPFNPAMQDASRYANRVIKQSMATIITYVGFAIAVYDSPGLAQLKTSTWDWIATTQSWNNSNGKLQVITWPGPGPGIVIPPPPDPPVPELPPIEPQDPSAPIDTFDCLVEAIQC